MLMLLCYSLGLGVPFMLSAVLIDRLKATFDFIKRNYQVINLICGALLVLVGILMATGLLGRFLTVLSRGGSCEEESFAVGTGSGICADFGRRQYTV
jgi:hypothetical protein